MPADPAPIDGDLLAQHTERMRGLARGLLRDYDQAEDVVQEAALKALTGKVRPRNSLAACLSGVVRNVAWKLGRSERRRVVHEHAAATSNHAPSTADLLARLDEQRRVLGAVRELDEPYRSTVLLRYIDGLPPRTIARRQEIPVETVKSRLKRGLARLREKLDQGNRGGRKAWLQALLPVAGYDHLLDASSTAALTTGGVMAQTTSNKFSIAALVLLLGGTAFFFATDGFGWMTSEEEASMTASTDADLEADPALEGRETDTGAQPGTETAPAREGAEPAKPTIEPGAPATPTGATGRASSTLPPVRHSPFAPPPPKEGKRDPSTAKFGTGGGNMGPTGHWTKFRLASPPKGTARLEVTVADENGIGVEGAKVYIGPEDVANQAAVSYGSLRKLGTTDRQGRYQNEGLTPGTVVVAANVGGLLTGRYGLDTRPGELARLDNGKTVEVRLTLPLSAKDLGAVEGRVTDTHGRPIPSASVAYERNVVRTDRDGSYRLLRVPAGARRIAISRWGWKPDSQEVEVRAGSTTRHDVTLAFKEGGSVGLTGRVLGPQGEAVPRCYVYLNVPGDSGTLRTVLTDADGRFAFKDLPERLTKEAVEVQGSGIPKYGSSRVQLEAGIADGQEVEIRIQERFVDVVLEVQDAATGAPVERTRIQAKRVDGTKLKNSGYFWYRPEKGGHDGMLPPGRYRVTVAALDHEDVTFELDVPHTDGLRHRVKLKRLRPDSVDVHLTIDLYSGAGDEPITAAKIEILDLDGKPLARFEGRRGEGRYLLPALSGQRILKITAQGHEPYKSPLALEHGHLEKSIRVRMQPR